MCSHRSPNKDDVLRTFASVTCVLRESSDESDDSADSEHSSDDDTASADSDGDRRPRVFALNEIG